MPEPLQEFTPERWETVKSVLSGEHGKRVSMKAAAEEAGVSLRTLRGWIRRSERALPEDDPLIHEIAVFMKDVDVLQAGTLEDVMWDRAIGGVDTPIVHQGEITGSYKKPDNRLLTRMLEVREERYRPKTIQEHRHKMDSSEVYARLLAGHRNATAKKERAEIELAPTEYEVVEEVALPKAAVKQDKTDDSFDDADLEL